VKKGSKHHLLTDGHGTPLVVQLTAANVPDMIHFAPMLDAYPVLWGPRGPALCHPRTVYADKGYDSASVQRPPHPRTDGTPRHRVERTFGTTPLGGGANELLVAPWLHRFRRLLVRYERRADIHLGFLSLACALIVFQFLHPV